MFSYTRAAHKLLVTHTCTCTCGCAVLLCLVCLTLLASFFLPSHLSFKNMYSKHQKKLPVLQNGTDSFVVENGRRTDTKRIAHGYRKERPVPFCFPFRSVYFLFVCSIPFHCVPFRSPRARRYSKNSAIRAVSGSSTRRSALPVAQCSSTFVREIRVILLRSSALYSLFGGRTRFFSWYICILTASLIVPQRPSWLWPSVFASALAVSS